MCGVIGAIIKSPSIEDLELVKAVFRESRIRGMHATGLSYLKDGKIHTLKEPKPADEFLAPLDFSSMINEDGNFYMVGHCRYSTSDLEYNQPFSDEDMSLVHNGVISQELPESWQQLYGYKCETKNDSELLFHTVKENKSAFESWPDASISAIELHSSKKMKFYRNGKRPLCFTYLHNGVILSSTKDVLVRTQYPFSIEPAIAGVVYTIDDEINLIREEKVTVNDLQPDGLYSYAQARRQAVYA